MKKLGLLLIAAILIISAVFVNGQMRMYEDKASFLEMKKNMDIYEYTEGMLGVAISRVQTSDAVYHNFGKPIYPADRSLQYVWVYIKLINSGKTAVKVNPKEFTLSAPGKTAVDYDYKASNSMQKYLKSISLDVNKKTIGVLIFPIAESKVYTLHYNGHDGKVEKSFVIDTP